MKVRSKILLCVLAVVALLAAAWNFVAAKRQGSIEWFILSENSIHDVILKNTPPGTDLQTCMNYIKIKMQPVPNSIRLDELNGALHSGMYSKMIGSKSIHAVLVSQTYPWAPQILFNTYVSFGFDDKKKLVDVVVEKEEEGP
jgi:hypothetical protein